MVPAAYSSDRLRRRIPGSRVFRNSSVIACGGAARDSACGGGTCGNFLRRDRLVGSPGLSLDKGCILYNFGVTLKLAVSSCDRAEFDQSVFATIVA